MILTGRSQIGAGQNWKDKPQENFFHNHDLAKKFYTAWQHVVKRYKSWEKIAAYEIMAQAFPDKFISLSGQLTDFTSIPKNDDPQVNVYLAALHAFLTVGTELIFSEDKMQAFQVKLVRTSHTIQNSANVSWL